MALKDLIRTTITDVTQPAAREDTPSDARVDGVHGVDPSVAESPEASRSPSAPPQVSAVSRAPTPTSLSTLEPAVEIKRPQAWSREDVESFKALGAELRLESNDYGEVWLVPNYTSRDRREITLEHLRVLASVMAILPGSRITAFNHKKRAPGDNQPQSQSSASSDSSNSQPSKRSA